MKKSNFATGPAKGARELSALLDILAPTFNFTREQGAHYSKSVGQKNYRVIRLGREVIGGCALLPMGQFFGGRSVPMMGVAAVGIAPAHRGRRTATTLMQAAVLESHKRGFALSALYPATLPLYRSAGYEHAGMRFEIRVPAKTLILKSREPGMQMRAATKKDDAAIRKMYTRHATMNPGNLDRSDFIWHRVREPRGSVASGYLVVNEATKQPEGYTFYLQKENALPPDLAHSPMSLHLTDLVALTPAAGRKLWEFFGDHRSMTDQIIYQGNPNDAMLKLLPDRTYSARLLDHWMLRVVDARAALLARGYSRFVNAEVHLDIADDLVPANNGRLVLSINNGKPKIANGGRGDLAIDIRGLAALFSGHLSPQELMIAGRLTASNRLKHVDEVLMEAASIFAGPAPWLGDMF